MHIFHQVIKCFRLLYRLFLPGTLPLVILKFLDVLQACLICQNARYYSVIYLVSLVKDDLVDVRLLRQLLVLIVVKNLPVGEPFLSPPFPDKTPLYTADGYFNLPQSRSILLPPTLLHQSTSCPIQQIENMIDPRNLASTS